MCIVKIDVSLETRQAFEGQDEEQDFEATQEEVTTESTPKESEPKVKEVVIDFN